MSLGLNAAIYPIKITLSPINIPNETTGFGHTATIRTNTNFLKYFNG